MIFILLFKLEFSMTFPLKRSNERKQMSAFSGARELALRKASNGLAYKCKKSFCAHQAPRLAFFEPSTT